MEKATLTISLPRPMKDFIGKKLQDGRFSTSREYIGSLIRNDQDLNGRWDFVAILRRLGDESVRPHQNAKNGARRTSDGIAKTGNSPRRPWQR